MSEDAAIIVNDALPVPDGQHDGPSGDKNAGQTEEKAGSFITIDDELYQVVRNESVRCANFHLIIIARSVLVDEARVEGQFLDLDIHFKGLTRTIRVSAGDFESGRIMQKIWEAVGTGAILYGPGKTLVIATQELSGSDVPLRQVVTSNGFTADGHYVSPGMRITPEGIFGLEDIEVDLSGGNFSRMIGFSVIDGAGVAELARHIHQNFLNLKSHAVTYPLMGHACLAPFISVITAEMGMKKMAFHLEGPSGSGKTMLASLAMSFFGEFRDHFQAWTSTANAIEREGYSFRDSLFPVDDLKSTIVGPGTVIRVLQNYVDGHGRGRMKSNGGLQTHSYIRGLLLSTGEDFVDNVESVNGRTIVAYVAPEKNMEAGTLCLENRHLYRSFMPGLIHNVISDPAWKENFRELVDRKVTEFHPLTGDLPNGLRISLNWALNHLGFYIFTRYIRDLGVIDDDEQSELLHEYDEIVTDHIQRHTERLAQDDPVSLMFSILGQKLEAGQVSVLNLDGTTGARGKTVGAADIQRGLVRLHPDLLMETLNGHYRSLGLRMPFSKKALRDGLARAGLIVSSNGRWTHQVRGEGGVRFNAWELPANIFKERCGIAP